MDIIIEYFLSLDIIDRLNKDLERRINPWANPGLCVFVAQSVPNWITAIIASSMPQMWNSL